MKSPEALTIDDARAYIQRQHRLDVTRQTIYNWIKAGKGDVKLGSITRGGQMFTTEREVDVFMSSIA
jgi:hypothetical protein